MGFCTGTKVFEEALNAIKFLEWLKTFGPAQNIFGPLKGQGINLHVQLYKRHRDFALKFTFTKYAV